MRGLRGGVVVVVVLLDVDLDVAPAREVDRALEPDVDLGAVLAGAEIQRPAEVPAAAAVAVGSTTRRPSSSGGNIT